MIYPLKPVLFAIIIILSILSTGCNSIENDKNLKIAIVGAGASGLTAAHTLKNLGYKNVNIFERDAEVGGKVHSYNYKGKAIEIGAVHFDATDYPTVMALADEHNVKYTSYTEVKTSDGKNISQCGLINRQGDCLPYNPNKKDGLKALMLLLPNLYFVETPGLTGGFSYINKIASDFTEEYGIKSLEPFLKSYSVSYGYGYFQEVPMRYYFKYTQMLTDGKLTFTYFKDGWQNLWKTIAKRLKVSLNSEVTNIRRYKESKNQKVAITINNDKNTTQVFDRVIISAPLESAHKYLDLTDNEAFLFKKIKNYEYYVTLIKLKKSFDVPVNVFGILEHLEPEYKGHIILAGGDVPEDNVFRIYQTNDWTKDKNEMFQLMKEDIELLGGEIDMEAPNKGILIQKRWQYFPHVKTNDLNDGFYEAIEKLQGKQGTYYIGGLLNLETVEFTAKYAKQLITKHF